MTSATPFARVLVPSDGSDPARAALKLAIAFGKRGAAIVIGTVVDEAAVIAEASSAVAYDPSPEMEALRAFTDQAQKGVSGTVRLKLYKGNTIVAGRKSDKSLYKQDFATFDKDAVYNQGDATGFIKLNALRLRIRAMQQGK